MATILLLSGPNLNLLGEREPEHYGTTTLDQLVAIARETAAKLGHDLEHVQSNHEGALIDAIHGARGRCATIVCNAARSRITRSRSATHSPCSTGRRSKCICRTPMRERWRHRSVLSPVVDGAIIGLKATGYRLAIEAAATLVAEQA